MASAASVTTPPPGISAAKFDHIYKVVPCRADLVANGEVMLPGLWKQLHDEGVFDMFFHDRPDLTFGQFVAALSDPAESLNAVVELDPTGNIVALAALSLLTQIFTTPLVRKGMGNFLLFKKYWDHRESTVIGKIILSNWFGDTELNLGVVAGVTPKLNRAALSFVHRMGFKSCGEIPDFCSYLGELCPGVVTRMTRAEWLALEETNRG